jgi:cytochrome c oxidase subunit II
MNQSILNAAGPQAATISNLWWFFFIVLISVFVLVMFSLFAALFRRHAAERGILPDMTPNHITERTMTKVVISSVVITAVLLFTFLVTSVVSGHTVSSFGGSDEPITISVTAAQWWWKIEYEDKVPSQIVTTANEIHIPAGKPVLLRLMSNDVIHSFWVPNLHGKRDLIPGKDNITLSLQADQPGIYRGQCAEFCGHQHAKMRFLVIAQSPPEFEAWLEQQRRPAAEPDNDAARHGRDVFLHTTCVTCHEIRGTDAGGKVAPELTHVASRMLIAAGTLPNTRDRLTEWISDPQHVKPGVKMPQSPLAPDDLNAVVAYMESLK